MFITIIKPDVDMFDRAYEKFTGSKPIPGRSRLKVFSLVAANWEGETVFGVCSIKWTDGGRYVTITY